MSDDGKRGIYANTGDPVKEKKSSSSLGKVHAAEQVLEARVGAQGIETGVDLQKSNPGRSLLICGFQPAERFLILS